MPWSVKENFGDCKGFAVVLDGSSDVVGCHKSRGAAMAQMRMLYSKEGTKARLSVDAVLAAEQIDDERRQWIEVLPVADKVRNGPFYFSITAEDLETYAQYVRDNPGKIPLDYDHESSEGRSTRAAGWFTGEAEVRPTDGGPVLYAQVQWTPRAVEEIGSGEYRRISAEFTLAQRDKKTGLATRAKELLAATLTNRPLFTELAPVASEFIDSAQLDAVAEKYGPEVADLLLAASDTEQARLVLATVPLNDPEKGTEMDLKVLATKLGLPEDADEAKVLAALEEKDEKIDTLTVEVESLKGPAAESDKLAERVQELEEKDTKREAELLVKDAITAGKLAPVLEEEYLALATENFDRAKAILDKAPVVANLKEKGSGGKGPTEPDLEAVRAEYGEDVDDESAALHARAMKILEEDGKAAGHTGDEYMAALERAEKVPA